MIEYTPFELRSNCAGPVIVLESAETVRVLTLVPSYRLSEVPSISAYTSTPQIVTLYTPFAGSSLKANLSVPVFGVYD